MIDFFNARVKIENFYDIVHIFFDIETYPLLRSEMMLLGLEDKFDAADNKKKTTIYEKTYDYFSEVRYQKILVGDFFIKMENLVDIDLD